MAARKKPAPKKRTSAKKKTTTRKTTAKRKPAARTTKRTAAKRPAAKKRTTAKRKPAKRTAAKRTTAKRRSRSVAVGRKPFTKSQFIAALCEQTELSRKEIVSVLESIPDIISAHVQRQGPEMFSWPGMFKIQVIRKPATKARKGVNPFTGETMMFKAKPASRRVKIRPLKQLKEMAA